MTPGICIENAIKRISKKANEPKEKEAQLRLDVYKWQCMGISVDRILEILWRKENEL